MTIKRFCPALDGESSLGKDGKRWGGVWTLALNGLALAPDGAATTEVPGMVALADAGQTLDPAVADRAVTPAGLAGMADTKLDLAAKADATTARSGVDDAQWMTPLCTAEAIAAHKHLTPVCGDYSPPWGQGSSNYSGLRSAANILSGKACFSSPDIAGSALNAGTETRGRNLALMWCIKY